MNSFLQKLKNKFHPCNDKIEIARSLGVTIGSDSIIYEHPATVFGSEPYLCKIGNKVTINDGVRFVTHNGGLRVVRELSSDFNDLDQFAPICIGDNVVFGINCVIMPGVNIGSNVIVGAFTLVNKSVPDNSVVAGIPARVICSLDEWMQKVQKRGGLVPTKHMNADEKKQFIISHYPEWFEE